MQYGQNCDRHSSSRSWAYSTHVSTTLRLTLFFFKFNSSLKVSNWKKVLERLVDYYEVHLGQRLSGFTMPDVSKIGELPNDNGYCYIFVYGCHYVRRSWRNSSSSSTTFGKSEKVCGPAFLLRRYFSFFLFIRDFDGSCLSCLVVIVDSLKLVVQAKMKMKRNCADFCSWC